MILSGCRPEAVGGCTNKANWRPSVKFEVGEASVRNKPNFRRPGPSPVRCRGWLGPGLVPARGLSCKTNPIWWADYAKQTQFPASRAAGAAHCAKQSQFGPASAPNEPNPAGPIVQNKPNFRSAGRLGLPIVRNKANSPAGTQPGGRGPWVRLCKTKPISEPGRGPGGQGTRVRLCKTNPISGLRPQVFRPLASWGPFSCEGGAGGSGESSSGVAAQCSQRMASGAEVRLAA
jgi:hypothetical protein